MHGWRRAVVLGSVLVAVATGLLALEMASAPRATADVGAPSWWSGDCDAPNWNARAAQAGWTGAGAYRLGASYLGVPVCGPRPGADHAPDVPWLRAGWGHLEWECTELAFRFMSQVYGVAPYGADGGTVVRNYTPAAGGGLEVVANGTPGRPPLPGDVVSFDSTAGGVGHVGVIAVSNVDGSGNGTVRMLSQNDSADGWRTLSVVGWRLQRFGTSAPYGWLHKPGSGDLPTPPQAGGRTVNDMSGIGASPTAVARRADGRLEQWGVNTRIVGGSNIFRRWQVEPGGAWSGWEPVEGYLTAVAVATNADGRLEVWGANAQIPTAVSNVFRRVETTPGGTWSGWEPVDGYLTGLSMTANADGRLEVWGVNTFIPDSVSNVFGRAQVSPGGSWAVWQPTPGYLTAIATTTNADGRLETWGVNTLFPDGANNIFGRAQMSAGADWAAWQAAPGYLTTVSVAVNADGRLTMLGTNTHLPDEAWNIFTRSQASPGGDWSGWAGVPGYLTSVTLAAKADDRLEAVGANTHLAGWNVYGQAQVAPGGAWSGWGGVVGYLTS
jgi:hypothetical protein